MRFRRLAALPLLAAASAGPLAAQPGQAPADDLDRPGLELVLRSRNGGATDARVARLAALYVPESEPSSPFLEPGPFDATFRGTIELDLNDSFRFAVRGTGGVRLSIGGQVVLERDTLPVDGAAASTESEVRLNKGLNPIELVYRSPAHGDASMRLTWSNDYLPEEAVPPASLRHGVSTALDRGRSRRTARDLVADAMCARCHNAATPVEASASAMPEAAETGPDLEGVGSRLHREWIEQWLLDPRALRPRARMPRLLASDPGEARQQAADLAAYLTTAAGEERAAEPGTPATAGDVSDGRRLYAETGCAACHEDEVLRLGDKWHPSALTAYLIDPVRFDPASRMPRMKLDAGEAASLAAYLLAATPENGEAQPARRDPPGDPERGRRLAEELRCRACHSLPGGEPAPAVSPLQRLAGRTDVWTTAAAEAVRHPRYDFTPREIEAIERLLAEDAASLSRIVPIEYAERRMRRSGCLACHGRDGAPAAWSPAAAAAATTAGPDQADNPFASLSETEDRSGPDHLPPDLTWTGEKLRSDWLGGFLAGSLDERPRPHLRVRMPSFRSGADVLAAGMHHQHGLPASLKDEGTNDPELAAIGRDLIRGDRLGCHACHALGDEPALGGEGSEETINFDLVRRRLRRPFFDWFLRDPQRVLPGSKMPQFVDEDGYTALYDVFDGEATRQFEAIWHYLGTID